MFSRNSPPRCTHRPEEHLDSTGKKSQQLREKTDTRARKKIVRTRVGACGFSNEKKLSPENVQDRQPRHCNLRRVLPCSVVSFNFLFFRRVSNCWSSFKRLRHPCTHAGAVCCRVALFTGDSAHRNVTETHTGRK